MKITYNPSVVVLSFGIAFTGSYLAISICEQYRQCRLKNVQSKLLSPLGYLMIMSICLGGVGIWCMHFVGMSAMIMYDSTGEKIEARYHIGYTILSLILVLLFSFLGFYISSYDDIFMKSKKEILDCIVQDASAYTISKAKNITPIQMIWIIGTHTPKYLFYGGLCTGSGVVVMHYVGMAAMQFHGRIHWNAGVIFASCFIAIFAATAAFWILFRFLSVYAHYEYLRIISAFIMAIAVCGMHYTGMVAGTFEMDNSVSLNHQNTISPEDAFLSGILITAIISLIGGIIVLSDLRHAVFKLSHELARADETIMTLPIQAQTPSYQQIQRYFKKRKHTNIQLSIINQTKVFEDYDEDDLSSNDYNTGMASRNGSIHRGVVSPPSSYRMQQVHPVSREQFSTNNSQQLESPLPLQQQEQLLSLQKQQPLYDIPLYTVDIENKDTPTNNNNNATTTTITDTTTNDVATLDTTYAMQNVQIKPEFVPYVSFRQRTSFIATSTTDAGTTASTTAITSPSYKEHTHDS